jgi:hypothetical protein
MLLAALIFYAMPPLMPMVCPVMYAACSETRNDTKDATSSGLPARFIGTIETTCS